ncbi:hypothetical protein GIW63_27255 [Pseudomonas syringae]|nr:hypothetical protein [Pseudomonas syringae]MCF5295408.1 hypothetical protein [Pseudomonas syringae]MCF5330816.1 hypothetical protein [Pseudomonas syringae]MCF5392832.1 hypothetical protein [Pseudomonas syringae]MCF5413853.1 hypothetical protein [Pseudomonas syringae]
MKFNESTAPQPAKAKLNELESSMTLSLFLKKNDNFNLSRESRLPATIFSICAIASAEDSTAILKDDSVLIFMTEDCAFKMRTLVIPGKD